MTGPLLHDDTLPDLSEGCPAQVISLSRISQKVLWEALEFKKKKRFNTNRSKVTLKVNPYKVGRV